MPTPLSDEAIARVCYEANRAYCLSHGDTSFMPWDDAPQWQRDTNIAGVAFHHENPDAGDAASHESWMAFKLADGWSYGAVKDGDAKTHPCLLPFDQLPAEQQAKDRLFRSIVHALSPAAAPAAIEETTDARS